MIYVNKTLLPAPVVMDVTLNPQSKSAERNGNGRLVRETLPDKWSIQLEWKFGTYQEYYNLFKFLSTLTRVNFIVKFPAPTGEMLEREFYISPISAKMLNFTGSAGMWKSMKCSFVEV